MNVEVTNWTFGGHGLIHTFSDSCTAKRGCDGVDHMSYLTDRAFDYVVIQGSRSDDSEGFLSLIERIMSIFRQANSAVKFAYLVPYSAYGTIGSKIFLYKNILNSLKSLSESGVTVVDWGGLVMDIMNGSVKVPDATQIYEKNTFVIQKSEKDGYHPNQLSGYITTLMTFCAITGATAVGQPYDFCNNEALRSTDGHPRFFSFNRFVSDYYSYGDATTNYPAVFASASDMLGIQSLIDSHLAHKGYLSYDF